MENYREIKKIGRACYLVEEVSIQKLFVLKKQPPILMIGQRLSRFLFGGSLPFQNEFRVLEQISKNDIIPHLPFIDFKKNTFYIIDFIKNTKDFKALSEEIYFKIGVSVAQIARIQPAKKWNFIKERMLNYLGSPTIRFYQHLKFVELKYSISTIPFRQLLNEAIRISKNIKPRYIHNDLGDNNVIVDEKNQFYFIDWEDARLENVAIFLDVVTLSFDYDSLALNKSLLNGFFSDYELPNIPRNELKTLFKLSYIIYLFKILKMKRFDELYKVKIIKLLEDFSKDISKLDNEMKHYLTF